LTYTLRNYHHLTHDKRLRILIYAGALSCGLLCVGTVANALLRHRFFFDDAYIFFRYARNIRHGLGVAWNPDGVPTYGLPSLPWAFVLSLFTHLPFPGEISLQLASSLAGVIALVLLTFTVVRNGKSSLLTLPPLAFIAVALPLLINSHFSYHLTTGMDTMLSLAANVLLIIGILRYVDRPTLARAILVSLIAFVTVLARPENVICALASPLIAWLGLPGRRGRHLAALLIPCVVLIGVDLLVCNRYFAVALPLAFFGKSLDAYAGFTGGESPLKYASTALLCVLPFVAVLGATFKNRIDATMLAFLLPLAVTGLCLLAVRQHMGFEGRFYVPFFPFIIIPALLCLDAALVADAQRTLMRSAIAIAIAFSSFAASVPLQRYLDRAHIASRMHRAIPMPSLKTVARDPLPNTDWVLTSREFGQLVARLPAEVVVAAGEVGYLGYASQDKHVIDLVGVNDTEIGASGFSMVRLLERAPDLLWLPPPDYTGLRAILLSDQRFFSSYEVIAGAFNNGVAIRRGSRYRDSLEGEVRMAWASLYPGKDVRDYIVQWPE
jgi:hypothetical protein